MELGIPGSRLYAYTGGRPFDPRLPCVVFLHGAQHDHSVWILQSRYLAHHGCAVLAIALPGTGHALMAENPDGVRRALASFAQQVFAGVTA